MFEGKIAFGYNSDDAASPEWDSAIVVQVAVAEADCAEDALELMEEVARQHYEAENNGSWGYDKCMLDALDEIERDEWERGGISMPWAPQKAFLASADALL